MPSLTPFPSGVYTLDILLDDTSFVKSSFEYERNSNEKKLEPIAYAIEEIDGSFTISFSPEIDGNVTIELYDASHSLLLTLKDLFTNEKLNDESFRESIDYIIIYSNNDIYRIIL